MKVESVVIGIPDWSWKKRLLTHAKRHPRLVEVKVKDLCYECSRHMSVLEIFNGTSNKKYKDTEYYEYQRKNKKSRSVIIKKIKRFQALYDSVKKDGVKVAPVITDDGCRLDGSHRCSIMSILNNNVSIINVVRYEDIFSKDKSEKIRNQVKKYRKRVYSL